MWGSLLGDRYIEIALRVCARANPVALQVINEYDLETADRQGRRSALLPLIKGSRGVPLHAIGLRAHLRGDRRIDRDITECRELDLEVLVTELDVIDNNLPLEQVIDGADASRVTEFLETVYLYQPPRALLTWGITDRYTWVPTKFKRQDEIENRPVPLDVAYQPKPLIDVLRRYCDMSR
jgi:endo-1,4-beta-xylanase